MVPRKMRGKRYKEFIDVESSQESDAVNFLENNLSDSETLLMVLLKSTVSLPIPNQSQSTSKFANPKLDSLAFARVLEIVSLVSLKGPT